MSRGVLAGGGALRAGVVVGIAGVLGALGLAVGGCSSLGGSSSSAPSSTSSPASSLASLASASAPASVTGGPATSPGASPSSAPAVSPTGGTSATASASGTGGGGGGGGGGAPGCATASLRAQAGTAEGAAGSVYQAIDFTNISSAACTLFGYPGVALTAGSPPAQVGTAATRSTATPAALVTLEPGETANFLLRITEAQNYPAATCVPTPTTALQIYPPNQTVPIYLPYTSTGCASTAVNLLSVGVVQPGTGSGG
jgi:hypothetical protein